MISTINKVTERLYISVFNLKVGMIIKQYCYTNKGYGYKI